MYGDDGGLGGDLFAWAAFAPGGASPGGRLEEWDAAEVDATPVWQSSTPLSLGGPPLSPLFPSIESLPLGGVVPSPYRPTPLPASVPLGTAAASEGALSVRALAVPGVIMSTAGGFLASGFQKLKANLVWGAGGEYGGPRSPRAGAPSMHAEQPAAAVHGRKRARTTERPDSRMVEEEEEFEEEEESVSTHGGGGAKGGSRRLEALLKARGDPTAAGRGGAPAPPAAVKTKRGRGAGRSGAAAAEPVAPPTSRPAPLSREAELTAQLHEQSRKLDGLLAENAGLREHLREMEREQGAGGGGGGERKVSALAAVTKKQEEDRLKQLSALFLMVQDGVPDAAIGPAIQDYKDAYGDFGSSRWNALRWHLRSLRSALLPNHITRMTMWAIESEGRAGGAGAGAGGEGGDAPSPAVVWGRIVDACEMSPEQVRMIGTLRESISTRRRAFADTLASLRGLEESVTANFAGLELAMGALMSILSPRQLAMFMAWMERDSGSLFRSCPSLAAWPGGGEGTGGGAAATVAVGLPSFAALLPQVLLSALNSVTAAARGRPLAA
jgi:hypothetical protein